MRVLSKYASMRRCLRKIDIVSFVFEHFGAGHAQLFDSLIASE